MKWSQATETGLVRKQNEDNFCICPDIGLFAIADGMGGHQAGEIASRLATQKLADFIRTYLEFYSDQETLLTKGMQEINHQIYLISQQNKRYQGMGTTLTVSLNSKQSFISGSYWGQSAFTYFAKDKSNN